jgi:hypothetical protein
MSHPGPGPAVPTAEGPLPALPEDLDDRMTAPALTFLAPPSLGDDHDHYDDSSLGTPASPTSPPARRRGSGRVDRPGLRMTRGAREAATGMKVTDADIQRCLDAPDDVSADPHTPSRTRFRRGNLVVLAGADGMVLRVTRRNR